MTCSAGDVSPTPYPVTEYAFADYMGAALVRLKVRNARGVKGPFRENAFRLVTDRNCVIVR